MMPTQHTTDPAGGYRRPVSATERLYLAAGDPRGTMALRVLVEGDGPPAPAHLRAALEHAAEACPGSRLVRRGASWYAGGPPPRLRYAEPAAGPLDPGDPATVALLRGPARSAAQPGCEVLVVPGTTSPTTLVFSASHALMDGHGALTWVRAVFLALRGEASRPAPGTDTDLGMLRRHGKSTGSRPTALPGWRSPLGPLDADPRRTLWLRRTLPGRHRALTARFAQALADTAGLPVRIMVPVDLRRHGSGTDATGNLTLPIMLDLSPGDPWDQGYARLLRDLSEGRELATGPEVLLGALPRAVSGPLLRAAQATSVRTDRHLASAVVSHLGRLDLREFSGGGFTATGVLALPVHAPLVPVSVVLTENVPGTSGADGTTQVTLGVRGGARLAERAARLLDDTLVRVTGRSEAGPGATARSATALRGTGVPGGAEAPASVPAPGTVVDLFRAQASLTPDAVALDGPEGVVTYGELDRRSDAVAAELLRRGVAAEDLVGLAVERSPVGVTALWGILKAGAAYLPLDPAHPDARLGELLRTPGLRICLTERHLLDRIRVLAPCSTKDAARFADAPAGLLPPGPGPDQLAYVMHTSGSTGRPKGVCVEHGGLAVFARWMADLCRVTATTRFGFASSYAFDISCFPLFLPMLAGGTTVLAPGPPTRAALRRLLVDHRADTLALTPSHLPLLAGHGAVHTLLLGGEPLTPAAVRTARAAFGPDCRLINGYGPTEATVACLAHIVDGSEDGPTMPLGTPGPGMRVDLVARDGTATGRGPGAVGRTGEIVVSGPQVARGYLSPDADGTSPFHTRPDGSRAYRTGDLGRRLPDGSVEFAGRADGQIKIAGHRVEPAETVAALEAHPAVSHALVLPRSRSRTEAPVLCAYVVPRTPAADHELAGQLRAALARRLPAHLVPAHVVVVAEIPSTVSGKADADALPDPFGEPAPAGEPAADTLSARVAGHWEAILGRAAGRLTPEADFQDLGGDSLALLEMLTAVSGDLLTEAQAEHFMGRLDCLVRDVTLRQVCEQVEAARREVPA